MTAWSEPRDLKTWIIRGFSLRGAVVLMIAMSIIVSEVRFNWLEIMVGRYLAATNSYRPESGNVWEQGRLKAVAEQTLEQMVNKKLVAQREARDATSLVQLFDGLTEAKGAMISAERFKTLYSQIPETAARMLFSPILILRLSSQKNWERVYLEREGGNVAIYLLDHANNVLSYNTINENRIHVTGIDPPTLTGSLDTHAEFAGRIYPAERFFMALGALSAEAQQAVIDQPGVLLSAEGNPSRVGISDEAGGGRIRIAVELMDAQGARCLLVSGQEWAVWEVRQLLEPKLRKRKTDRLRWPGFGIRGER